MFSFGFDMIERKINRKAIFWCDPVTKSWELSAGNQAGNYELIFDVEPQFIREITSKHVITYQPGICIELIYIGAPYVWAVNVLRSEDAAVSSLAA